MVEADDWKCNSERVIPELCSVVCANFVGTQVSSAPTQRLIHQSILIGTWMTLVKGSHIKIASGEGERVSFGLKNTKREPLYWDHRWQSRTGRKVLAWLSAAPRALGERAVTSMTHQGHPSADLPWTLCPPWEKEHTMPTPTRFFFPLCLKPDSFLFVKLRLHLGNSANMWLIKIRLLVAPWFQLLFKDLSRICGQNVERYSIEAQAQVAWVALWESAAGKSPRTSHSYPCIWRRSRLCRRIQLLVSCHHHCLFISERLDLGGCCLWGFLKGLSNHGIANISRQRSNMSFGKVIIHLVLCCSKCISLHHEMLYFVLCTTETKHMKHK